MRKISLTEGIRGSGAQSVTVNAMRFWQGDCKRAERLWVRFPLEKIKYLLSRAGYSSL